MKLSNREKAIVLRAAELVASGVASGCCHAIQDACPGGLGYGKLKLGFIELFDMPLGTYWFSATSEEFNHWSEEARDARVLCLLTFAELG